MPHVVNFENVSAVGLESSPVADALAGLRANEAGLFLDLDTERTARVLGIAPGTVQAHLGRAMASLRSELIPVSQEESR